MPAQSEAQLKAMFAAKEGHSTLGIPKKIGAEYVAATKSSSGLPEHVQKRADNCPIHGYLDSIIKGDAQSMSSHAKKFGDGK